VNLRSFINANTSIAAVELAAAAGCGVEVVFSDLEGSTQITFLGSRSKTPPSMRAFATSFLYETVSK
jgi:hypothetical protein